jgi:hypothetical protein
MVTLLTQLPPEVRNIIYRMVLSEKGLTVWIDPVGISRICIGPLPKRASFVYLFTQYHSSSTLGFNQLKFVNRMFYRETRGLECRINAIQGTPC